MEAKSSRENRHDCRARAVSAEPNEGHQEDDHRDVRIPGLAAVGVRDNMGCVDLRNWEVCASLDYVGICRGRAYYHRPRLSLSTLVFRRVLLRSESGLPGNPQRDDHFPGNHGSIRTLPG